MQIVRGVECGPVQQNVLRGAAVDLTRFPAPLWHEDDGGRYLGTVCIAATAALYRPLTLTSVVPEIAEARGIRGRRVEIAFLIVLALATTMTVPVTGALLIFSLMIGPPAAARSLTSRPALAMILSVAIALLTVWAAIAASYLYNWPVGFFVGALAALSHGSARTWAAWRRTRTHPGAALPSRPAIDGA